ncbi:hypothetical protein DL767_003613 [Monosporascus sp. MG133]|nr:hypothetical protein DL767_003613 [Monosporascus sp. MG133]
MDGISLSFTLPLRDSALGTTPLTHQRPALHLLKKDACHVATAVPQMLSAIVGSVWRQRTSLSWRENREILIYVLVSAIEVQLLVLILPLWLFTPGIVCVPWVCLHVMLIWLLLRRLNGTEQVFTSATGAPSTEEAETEEDFFWIVIGGIDVTHERIRRTTLPNLAKLFGRDMHAVLPYRLGLPFEIILLYIRRNIQFSTSTSTILYDLIRVNLLRQKTSGVRVLVHNTGALDMALVLSRLYADLPGTKILKKLEVFTFGAASAEMTAPPEIAAQDDNLEGNRRRNLWYPNVTHFAFENDPFPGIGVYLGIRQRLEGRFIGSLFSMGRSDIRPRRWTLDDYIDTLFPNGDPRAGILGQTCKINREASEMRELAALVQSVNDVQLRMRKGSKRLSWTALGAVANKALDGGRSRDDHLAGAFSLDEVRRRGKALQGMRGFENNTLAAAVRGPHRLLPDGDGNSREYHGRDYSGLTLK